MTDKRHVFISYSGDRGTVLARRVSRLLGELGIDADLPIKPIWEPDNEWDDEVIADIRNAEAVIFIEPADERLAPHVLFEIGAAHALGKRIFGVGAEREEVYADETSNAAGVLHIYDLIDATNLDDAALAAALDANLGADTLSPSV